jgi:hypothetical protein
MARRARAAIRKKALWHFQCPSERALDADARQIANVLYVALKLSLFVVVVRSEPEEEAAEVHREESDLEAALRTRPCGCCPAGTDRRPSPAGDWS